MSVLLFVLTREMCLQNEIPSENKNGTILTLIQHISFSQVQVAVRVSIIVRVKVRVWFEFVLNKKLF